MELVLDTAQILIVEDESIIAMEIEDRLIAQGYIVQGKAASGVDALERVSVGRPDLVLMDIVLKGPLDGIQTAARIRDDFDIPVIYLTANADEKTLDRAKVTEPYGYLIKPFEERELHTTIEMALYKHSMEKKLRESQQWFSTTLNSVTEGVIATDVNGFVTYMNQIAEDLTGWRQDDAVSLELNQVFNLVYEQPSVYDSMSEIKIFKDGTTIGLGNHTFLVAKDGSKIPVDDRTAPILNDHGESIGVIVVFRDITNRIEAEQYMHYVATHDVLTDLPNRYMFQEYLDYSMANAKRNELMLAVMFVDLDGFKTINDNLGHARGDALLKQIASRLQKLIRGSDFIARMGGDEFVFLVNNLADIRGAETFAQRILNVMAEPLVGEMDGEEIFVTASIGVSLFPKDSTTAEELLHQADAAMYSGKDMGKNTYHFFSSQPG
ncbi:MAG: diguanylate cyclase [Anaerolineae bacterium]|nr:diguanylate cyclase [Anaerolineae bacterium]